MLRILKCRFILLMAVMTLSSVQSSLAAEESLQRLVSPELLENAGLKILWENLLPTKTGESLERMLILGDRLYAISDKNYMLCLTKEKGKRVFSRIVAPAGLRIEGLKLYGNELISIAGSQLFEIDPNTGIERNSVDVGFGIVCPADRNSSYFYVCGADRRLHTLHAENRVQVFKVAAENDSMITSVLADESFVVFGTDQGNIISIMPNLPKRLWQFNAPGAIAGPIKKDGMSLYFASEDMNVYRVDVVGLPEGRRLVWKYQTSGILKTAPRVTQSFVYQSVYGKGVTAIDKDNGSFLWSVPGGVDLLAEAGDRAYVITKDGTLVTMDNIKRKRLYSVNFAGVSKHAANLVDSKIYIADKFGRIACLQPVD